MENVDIKLDFFILKGMEEKLHITHLTEKFSEAGDTETIY